MIQTEEELSDARARVEGYRPAALTRPLTDAEHADLDALLVGIETYELSRPAAGHLKPEAGRA